MDNMNIRKINGFTVQLVADGVYAIDEFGIALMYLIIGKTQALLLDTGVGAGNVHAVVKELTGPACRHDTAYRALCLLLHREESWQRHLQGSFFPFLLRRLEYKRGKLSPLLPHSENVL